MLTLTQKEQILIIGLVVSLLLGAVTQHFREQPAAPTASIVP